MCYTCFAHEHRKGEQVARFNKESIELALGKKYTKTEIKLVIEKNIVKYSDEHKAMILKFNNFSIQLATEQIFSLTNKRKDSIKRGLIAFVDKCKKNGLDMNELVEEKAQKMRPKKAKKNEVERAVSKLAPVLDIFSINKRSTLEILNSIEDEDTFSTEALVKSYKVLYHLLMAKASGETVTRKTSTQYNMVELADGTFSKAFIIDNNGNQKMTEETQSYLPDEKAFAGALVVLEVIKNLEGGNKEYLTQEEKEARYDTYMDEIERQRIEFQDKDYEDIEAIEHDGGKK